MFERGVLLTELNAPPAYMIPLNWVNAYVATPETRLGSRGVQSAGLAETTPIGAPADAGCAAAATSTPAETMATARPSRCDRVTALCMGTPPGPPWWLKRPSPRGAVAASHSGELFGRDSAG